MKRPVVSPAFLSLSPPPNPHTLQEEIFDSPLTFQNSWSVSNKWDTQKRKFRPDGAAEEMQLTSGHHFPSIGERNPALPKCQSWDNPPQKFREISILWNASCEYFPSLLRSHSLFHLRNAEQPSHCCFDCYTTDNCCEPYTQGATILGRNFRVVSNKQYFLTSLEICHLLTYLSGVRFPLSRGKKELWIRTRADAFPTWFIKNAFTSGVAMSWESLIILHSQERLSELRERAILMAGYPHHCSMLAVAQNESYKKMPGWAEGHRVH